MCHAKSLSQNAFTSILLTLLGMTPKKRARDLLQTVQASAKLCTTSSYITAPQKTINKLIF